VIAHFYEDIMITDYSKYPQDSLYAFYTESVKGKREKMNSAKIVLANGENRFTANHYFLLFDAMRMLPNFNKLCMKQQKDDLEAWAKVVHTAKASGEIVSVLTSEEIAKLFVYSGKGIGINYIMADNIEKSRKVIKELWDSLYTSLKK